MRQLPNILTASRVLLIPGLVFFFYYGGEHSNWLCAVTFSLAAITDWFDGYLARKWSLQSGLGRVFDPIADKLLVAAAILLLVENNSAHILPALAILSREITVSGLREYLAELNVSVPVSRLAKVKTGVQMTALIVLFIGYTDASSLWFILGQVLLWLAAGLTLFTGYVYLRIGLKHV